MKYAASLAALALGVLGCAHGEADGERRVLQLREELARVEADRDRVDQRLVALETQTAARPPETKAPPAPAATLETPPLRVVRIGPDETSPAEPAPAPAGETAPSVDDGAIARPVLRVTGRARGRGLRGAKEDVVVETLPPEEALRDANPGERSPALRERVPRPSALDPDARRAYDEALALVHAGRCQQALDAFAGFIVRWPDHPNADNALYWRGECYAALGDLPRAIEQFEGTIARFPLGNKVPDALLKLGISNTKLGNQARAKEAFDRLEREYPRSEARRRIPHGAANKP
jgi:tol-pal system protein YbgF